MNASVSRRCVAFLVDYLILGLAFELIRYADNPLHGGEMSWGLAAGLCSLWIARDIPYGKSPGKWVLKLTVVRVNGAPCSILRLLLRNLLLPWLGPLEWLVLMASQDHRRMGDWIAGTKVVHVRKQELLDERLY